MSANSLVAGPVDTSSALGGTMLVESLYDLSRAIESENWLAAGLAGISTVLDTAAAVMDPLGQLIAAGLGWLMEHVEPLKGWLNDLTGDAGAVLGFAGTWDNIATQMGGAAGDLDHLVAADLESMRGQGVAAYVRYADDFAEHLRGLGASSTAVADSLRTCSTIVQVVHDLVRDALAELVGAAISWAAQIVFTLGLGTPWVISQVATRVSALAARVGSRVTDVISSARALSGLIDALKAAIRRLGDNIRGARPGSSHTPSTPNGPGTPDAPTVQTPDDIRAWLDQVNPNYNGSPHDPYSNNCGSCSVSVHDGLNGGAPNPAGPDTLTIPEMEAATGLPQVPMSPTEIADELIAGGPGSHAVIGIDRPHGPGHWFNAYYDGTKVYAVDGQTGQILDWPPSYGASNWDAAIVKKGQP